ncbi:hydantoin racemase [Xylariaceae sp. FL0255]|nr:hydantoin racemase [Xylariaceae sp. FL0255]
MGAAANTRKNPFTLVRGAATRILVLNPNSSQSMTDGMRSIIDTVGLPHSTEIYTYTAPATSPASINDDKDLKDSTEAVVKDPDLRDGAVGDFFDGTLVACYSVHPLVTILHQANPHHTTITGIFEASILTALSLLRGPCEKWGIVTTGKFWEEHLTAGVNEFLGTTSESKTNTRFAGVQSTGLNASDFHGGLDPAFIREKLKEATKRLLVEGEKDGSQATVIVMGCAGMAGLEDIIREAAQEHNGKEFAYSVLHVVDGVRAGIMQMDQIIRNKRLRPGSNPTSLE